MMTLDEIEAKIDEAIRNDESYACEYWKGYRDATKRNIDSEPVIISTQMVDVVELRHAHWIKSPNMDGFVVCSQCNSDNLHAQMLAPVPPWYKYCPKCGAKMDEDETK